MSRCVICGHIDGHSKLTHRNQILLEWWPLYHLATAKSHLLKPANRAEDVPRTFLAAAEAAVLQELGPDIRPGVM